MLATGGDPPRPGNLWTSQAISFIAMILPITIYFAVCETSRRQASIGKRVVGLLVSRRSGGRLSFVRALLRTLIKFVPWVFGHTVAHQAALAGEGDFPGWLWGPVVIAVIVPLWWGTALFATGDTPYDRWTGVRVVRAQEAGS